ncbi:MAG: phosphodiesterase [Pseudomonadota bacterium]|nr:phosphodiesterase [Pseudomonadota bacterium]
MSRVTIAQLTDLHVRPEGVPAYRVAETNMLTERALCRVAAEHPAVDAVIITGDLTDCGLPAEYDLLAAMLRRTLSMPVYLIPGNHDRREVLLQHLLGTRSMAGGFVQYAVDDLPVRLVMLDTVVPGAGHGALCQQRLDWLDRTLAERADQPTLIGMHHPPFQCGIAHMDGIALHDPAGFVAVIARHRQVHRIVCGHHHRPVVAPVAHAIASIAPSVAHQVQFDLSDDGPAAFVMEPSAFDIHLWDERTSFVSHTALVEAFPGPYPFLSDPDYPGRSD